ncbi:MAG: DUF1893 domain-containing protein [Clostridia bacterium]|nr:DUF1893 domain-containing protein [Clostridia bacterium]
MNKDLALARDTMATEKLTLCVARDGKILARDTAHGIVPLARLALSDMDFQNAAVADRVTGRAAAILLARLKISALYTGVLSQASLPILDEAGIAYTHDTLTAAITNRVGNALCPMEALAAHLSLRDADKLLSGIKEFFEKQGVNIAC